MPLFIQAVTYRYKVTILTHTPSQHSIANYIMILVAVATKSDVKWI